MKSAFVESLHKLHSSNLQLLHLFSDLVILKDLNSYGFGLLDDCGLQALLTQDLFEFLEATYSCLTFQVERLVKIPKV